MTEPRYLDVSHNDAEGIAQAARLNATLRADLRRRDESQSRLDEPDVKWAMGKGLLNLAGDGRFTQSFSCACGKPKGPSFASTPLWGDDQTARPLPPTPQELAARVDRVRQPKNLSKEQRR